jgi:hypothetical protein
MRQGMKQIGDTRSTEHESFLGWNEVRAKFRLQEVDFSRYNQLIASILVLWIQWLLYGTEDTDSQEYIEFFGDEFSYFLQFIIYIH